MSVTYYMVCDDCMKSLWVGQRGAGTDTPWIYRSDEAIDKFEAFLSKHQEHRLRFVNEFLTVDENDMVVYDE